MSGSKKSSDRDARSSGSSRSKEQFGDACADFVQTFFVFVSFGFLLLAFAILISFYIDILVVFKIKTHEIRFFPQESEDRLSALKTINYTLDLEIQDLNNFQAQLLATFVLETNATYLIMYAGSELSINSAEILGKERQEAFKIERSGDFLSLYFEDTLLANTIYVLNVTYTGVTTNQTQGGLYRMNVVISPEVLVSIRGLTRIECIVPVFDVDMDESVWVVSVTLPEDMLVYSTSPVHRMVFSDGIVTKIFAPTPPIIAADLSFVIGSDSSIEITDITDSNFVFTNKDRTTIHVHLIGMVNGGHMRETTYLVHEIKTYLEQYPFFNFEQIGFLVFDSPLLPIAQTFDQNYFVGGNLVASSYDDALVNTRIFSRLLFGNRFNTTTNKDKALLLALADYASFLALDSSEFVADTIEKIRHRVFALTDGTQNNDERFSKDQNSLMVVFPNEQYFNTDVVIIGLHALAKLVGVGPFISYVKAFAAYSHVNTLFTIEKFGEFIELSLPYDEKLICDNNADTPFRISKYLLQIVSSENYLSVSASTNPDNTVTLKQSPFENTAVPMYLQDLDGHFEPFVLCKAEYTLWTPGVTVYPLPGYYKLDFEHVPEKPPNDESEAARNEDGNVEQGRIDNN